MQKMLRLGFDAKRLFNNATGLGNYSRTLLQNLLYYYPDYAYFLYTPRVMKTPDTKTFLNSPAYSVHTPASYERLGWRTFGIRRQLKKHRIDLYHGLSNELPYGLDRMPLRSVVSIHDLIFRHYPHQYPRTDRMIYDLKTRYACRHADRIIAISESTKQDLMSFYGVPEHRIRVLYQTCAEQFLQDKSDTLIEKVSRRYQLPDEYMLYVGSITPRKNLLSILEAMTRMPKSMELPLVIVGSGKAYLDKVKSFIRQHGLDPYVFFIQPLNEDLPFIYQKANLFIYPSLYEGFGIPIIEALFSRTPVITSQVSSMPEAAGPDSLLIDPTDVDAIGHAIRQVLEDTALRQSMTEKGYAYAQRFRGETLSKQLVDIYQEVLEG